MNYKEYKHIMKQNKWNETRAVKQHLENAARLNEKYKEALELMRVGILDYKTVLEAYNKKDKEIHEALRVARNENRT